ncbi:MAG: radical SAM protein [Nitrospina sp.]|jgi:tRNA A37 methylthiotransferase MiaB|nr:radical SAM protein [Nitrospina sp.]MBT3855445.1 radical SAM protein [Nitrospina sp.]MBT4105227.1 radical SAM protein [Nitrospina sp.]MBT4390328.1 radical SAM protein [Nitrospina sp.]MBT4622127.1 radical SAM protein [Nitrospina sp.]
MPTKTNIYFADLSHTGTIVSANFFPLAIGYVAANLNAEIPGQFEIELFKYPNDLSSALSRQVPRVMGFSNYSWNINLSYEYVKQIKRRFPETVIVMGGPNYGLTQDEIEGFWSKYPLIDFYIVFEGEIAMVELVRGLQSVNYNVDELKRGTTQLPNCHYKFENTIVQEEPLPRIGDLNNLPSPYIGGLMDKFFDGILIPMISTTRGCPFKCTFCSEGHSYYSKVSKRHNLSDELAYIADRVGSMTDLCLTDANWGMFKEDIDKATALAEIQSNYGWPKKLVVSSGKNQKERVMKVASLLNGAMFAGGAMQSTDPNILKNIKRSNISLEELGSAKDEDQSTDDVDSYTELILALPGDSAQAHSKSLRDMVEIGVNRVRMYQLIMLRQTEMNTKESRDKYGLKTKFRLMPRSFGKYEFLDEKFTAVEFEEICVGNNTMSFEEYLDCREMDLTVEILNNGRLFHELSGLCKKLNLSWFNIILRFHNRRRTTSTGLTKLYDDFRSDSVTGIWETRDELETSVKKQIDEYLSKDEGTNEMANGKATAIFKIFEDVHDLLFDAMEKELQKHGLLDEVMALYLKETKAFSKARKTNLMDTVASYEISFNFDFKAIMQKNFIVEPGLYKLDQPATYFFKHDQAKINSINSYLKQYGDSFDGLGRILMRAQYAHLIRETEVYFSTNNSDLGANPDKSHISSV